MIKKKLKVHKHLPSCHYSCRDKTHCVLRYSSTMQILLFKIELYTLVLIVFNFYIFDLCSFRCLHFNHKILFFSCLSS